MGEMYALEKQTFLRKELFTSPKAEATLQLSDEARLVQLKSRDLIQGSQLCPEIHSTY